MTKKVFILNADEAAAVWDILANQQLNVCQSNPNLITAIGKLCSDGEELYHPPIADIAKVDNGVNVYWQIRGNKVAVIKAIRAMTRWGLYEAKVFVDAHTAGTVEPNNWKIIFHPHDINKVDDDLMNVRYECNSYNVVLEVKNA